MNNIDIKNMDGGSKKKSKSGKKTKSGKKMKGGDGSEYISMPVNTDTPSPSPPVPTFELPAFPTQLMNQNMNQNMVQTEVLPEIMLEGGKKKSSKTKKGGECSLCDTDKTGGKKTKKPKAKGGSLVSDLSNLAVPFAILLAKQGLASMFDSKKTAKTLKKSSLKGGHTNTVVGSSLEGGDCGCGAPPSPAMIGGKKNKSKSKSKKGGEISKKVLSLSAQIDNFLNKY